MVGGLEIYLATMATLDLVRKVTTSYLNRFWCLGSILHEGEDVGSILDQDPREMMKKYGSISRTSQTQ